MYVKMPFDANWNPIQALTPLESTDTVSEELWKNESKSVIIRICALDGDATMIVSPEGLDIGNEVFLPQWLPEYFHIPTNRYVYCNGATINFTPCV